LPSGFKRIRHYGILASSGKQGQLARCRIALDMPTPDAAVIETVAAFFKRVSGRELLCCPHCGRPAMQLVEAIAPVRTVRQSTGPPP
jgi:4-hydroxy-3-methylbut-2-en-1-yl diphosphate synthase IspG/GcpE